MGQRCICITRKMDESKVDWIVRKKRKGGTTYAQIAKSMNAPVIGVKKMWF